MNSNDQIALIVSTEKGSDNDARNLRKSTSVVARSKTSFDYQRTFYPLRPVYTNIGLPFKNDKFFIRRSVSIDNEMKFTNQRLSRSARGINLRKTQSLDTQKFKKLLIEDEEEERPKKSVLALIGIGLIYFGIEVLFSMETALTAPILLKLNVPEKVYSLVWVFSPLLGVLLQPILGALSDSCQSRFGRRRPFVLFLSVGAFMGIILFLNNLRIGKWFGDNPAIKAPINAIVFTAIGVTLLDFCADSSDSPLRALILDICNQDDQDSAFNIHAILGGLGSAVGYVLSAINWEETFFKFIGTDLEILFIFALIIFLTTLTVTLLTAKEKPLILRDEKQPLIDNNNKYSNTITNLPFESEPKEKTKFDDYFEIVENEIELDSYDQPISLKLLFKSMLKMPIELIFLLICQTIGWLAHFSLSLFLTDFVAQTLYNGDPIADPNSLSYARYNTGVKMGCWCLFNEAVCSAIYAFILEKFLLTRFSTKFLFLFGFLLHGICVTCFFFTKNIYVILTLCTSAGILSTTLSTLPYQMLSEFHQDDIYRSKSAEGTKRGFGIDCALISSCFFLAQTLVALYTSPLIGIFGDYTVVVTSASFAFIGCFWVSLFMKFPIQLDE